MKNLFLAICLIAFIASCSNRNNDLKKWKLNGKVKSVVEVQYFAIEKFGEIVEGSIDRLGSNRSMVFNEQGNLMKTCRMNTCSDYKLEDNGNLNILDFDQDSKFTGQWVYIHDSRGNVIEHNQYDKNYNLIAKTKYLNNEHGDVIKESSYKADGSPDGITEYKYDNKGNQSEETWINTKGQMIQKTEYKYDDDRNLIEAKSSIPSNLFLLFQYKYVFDNNNNWIKEIFINEGKPENVIKREIKYWN